MSNAPLYTFFRSYGNNILFRYRKDGKSHSKKINFYKPSLYTPSDDGTSDALSIFDQPLKQIQFDSLRDAKNFVNMYKDVDGFEIHGNSDYGNQFVIEMYQGKMPEFSKDQIRIGILDIEVHSPEFPEPSEAKWPINGITIYDSFTDVYYCIGDKEYVHNKNSEFVGHLNVEFIRTYSEVELLTAMLNHFKEFDYDITSGWNSEMFDMPYIVGRCYKILGQDVTNNSLSPYGIINIKEVRANFGKPAVKVDIVGMQHLDYLALYKKHTYVTRESYKLDFIGEVELGMKKISYEEAGTLANLYETNPQKFLEYNIRDVDIVKRLDDKLGLFFLTMTLAYFTMSNYEDTLGTTKVWENLIAKQLYVNGKVPLFRKVPGEVREFDGAYVRDPIPGFHEWLISEDLNSLYPHIEMQVNIGPDTYVPRDQLPQELLELKSKYTLNDLVEGTADLSVLKKYDLSMAANFEFYRKDKRSVIAEIKDDLYKMRKVYKGKMIKAQALQQEIKAELSKRGAQI